MARKILDEEFSIDGIRFVIRKNHNKNEFEGRYKLMWYLPDFDSWGRITTDDSLRFLKEQAIKEAKCLGCV